MKEPFGKVFLINSFASIVIWALHCKYWCNSLFACGTGNDAGAPVNAKTIEKNNCKYII